MKLETHQNKELCTKKASSKPEIIRQQKVKLAHLTKDQIKHGVVMFLSWLHSSSMK